ncbi:MAG: tetratricopeptide repeat protein [Ignavibacteria bacterium]|nr:tetratricopeptide repeat protein [Ignavibacteria bacterium]
MNKVYIYTAFLIIIALAVLSSKANSQVLNESTNSDTELLNQGYAYINSNQYEDAISSFNTYLKSNPNDVKVNLQLGYLYSNMHDYEKAYEKFKFVSENSTNSDEAEKAKISMSYINQLIKESEKKDSTKIKNDLVDKGYYFINNKQYDDAINAFETYLLTNPGDTKVNLQLGYLYSQKQNYDKANDKFKYVSENSNNTEDVENAKTAMLNIKGLLKNTNPGLTPSKDSLNNNINGSGTELLNKGYDYVNKKQYSEAIAVFKTYLISNPGDTKINMQLGYLYSETKSYENAYDRFSYVAENSTNPDEVDKSRTSMWYMRDLMIRNAKSSFDLYFYNMFDSYYHNYVSNLLAHINFKLTKGIYAGPYVETYLDSKSSADNIINDRFFDIGGFTKFQLTDYMNLEVRVGYVREIDKKINSVSFKPILSLGTRLGNASFYKDRKTSKTENFYFDIYGVGLYDYKFRNVFAMLQLKEVLRYMTGGYSYMEFYTKQEASLDSKQLYYNNYLDFGAGIAFKPNLVSFPTLFVEAVSRNFLVDENGVWLNGSFKSIFQFRGGFIIYFNTKL